MPWKSYRARLTCQWCGDEYLVKRYRAKTSKWCSYACAGKGRAASLKGNRHAVGHIPRNKGAGHGYVTENGYRRIKVDGQDLMEHRVVWEEENGPIPLGHSIHHLNGNKLDNRLENLELLTRGQHSTHHNRHRTYRVGWHHSEETKRKIGQGNRKPKPRKVRA